MTAGCRGGAAVGAPVRLGPALEELAGLLVGAHVGAGDPPLGRVQAYRTCIAMVISMVIDHSQRLRSFTRFKFYGSVHTAPSFDYLDRFC